MAEQWGLDIIYHDANPDNCYRTPLPGVYDSREEARIAQEATQGRYAGTGEIVVFAPARAEHYTKEAP